MNIMKLFSKMFIIIFGVGVFLSLTTMSILLYLKYQELFNLLNYEKDMRKIEFFLLPLILVMAVSGTLSSFLDWIVDNKKNKTAA